MEDHDVTTRLVLVRDFKFLVDFGIDGLSDLVADEPKPLGDSSGPNASRLLAAAMGQCLSASLLFCARKVGARLRELETNVTLRIARNEEKLLRVSNAKVDMRYELDGDKDRLARCIPLFEKYCIVTASVRTGFPVTVTTAEKDKERA